MVIFVRFKDRTAGHERRFQSLKMLSGPALHSEIDAEKHEEFNGHGPDATERRHQT